MGGIVTGANVTEPTLELNFCKDTTIQKTNSKLLDFAMSNSQVLIQVDETTVAWYRVDCPIHYTTLL